MCLNYNSLCLLPRWQNKWLRPFHLTHIPEIPFFWLSRCHNWTLRQIYRQNHQPEVLFFHFFLQVSLVFINTCKSTLFILTKNFSSKCSESDTEIWGVKVIKGWSVWMVGEGPNSNQNNFRNSIPKLRLYITSWYSECTFQSLSLHFKTYPKEYPIIYLSWKKVINTTF